ncbi:MAG: hypothetical protein EOS52_23680 [Mesorhizobium sp.]|uniref:hypothetical protein n=1 Tax=Mesorhizobium sp. TaxID=1871066 RepID=UPI000FE9B842|nr:hypothetical protein [Mesorhizobium sp.]RWC10773.1 MAG: hypothetical protein EOS52_23680 [Mesorhizobium sp.]
MGKNKGHASDVDSASDGVDDGNAYADCQPVGSSECYPACRISSVIATAMATASMMEMAESLVMKTVASQRPG